MKKDYEKKFMKKKTFSRSLSLRLGSYIRVINSEVSFLGLSRGAPGDCGIEK
jgi:hypothetical protein